MLGILGVSIVRTKEGVGVTTEDISGAMTGAESVEDALVDTKLVGAVTTTSTLGEE